MPVSESPSMLYSVQRTYILTNRMNAGKEIVTCEQRIDIPTIESLSSVTPVLYDGLLTVIPCIELAGEFLSEFNLTFETNEGVTVLPVEIQQGSDDPFEKPFENPYLHFRYVLVLPRGATGVKSCKLIHKATGKEVQHNFTFGIMPPPYNYDNALFGYFTYKNVEFVTRLVNLTDKVNALKLTTKTPTFAPIELPKGAGEQTINIENGVLFYETQFIYSSPEPSVHKPKITLNISGYDQVFTLSLNKATNNVSIDLFTGMITVYDWLTGEIIQQFKLATSDSSSGTLSFENFDDIATSALYVNPKGAHVRD